MRFIYLLIYLFYLRFRGLLVNNIIQAKTLCDIRIASSLRRNRPASRVCGFLLGITMSCFWELLREAMKVASYYTTRFVS
jgi:hypothetical protein